ncbi:MAG: M3 family oligoendopeptidase [bacterium]|nr:M3 family oligoendopeptidase [bacterium]
MKIKTSWDFRLLYKSDNDPQLEKDLKHIEKTYLTFEKKYKNKLFTKTPKALVKALKDFEKLHKDVGGSKPWWYFALKTSLNTSDNKSGAMATKNQQRLQEAANKTKFFVLEIGRISLQSQKKFLKHESLLPYQYLLENIFRRAKFTLSEEEEQLSSLLSQTSYNMWIDTQQRLLNEQLVKQKGKEIPIVQVITGLVDLPKKERRKMHIRVNEAFKSISAMAEGEINAVYNYKKMMDKRRRYEKPYSATIIGYENDEKAIENFVALVSKYFKVSHRFYKLHARLLGDKKITLADRGAKIGQIKKKFDFETAVSILRSVLGKVDREYVKIFDEFLKNGQIDVRPRKGKKGGAFCWGMGQLPTFVLLNHIDDVRSLETLAHEMGHAIHTELSKRQPERYQGYSTATAEVASTFFEQLVSNELEQHLSEKEKIILFHNRLLGDISTIFRQIACFNFELELHNRIREDGQVSKDDIAELLVKHLKSYVGPAVEVTHDDGYFFVYWSHIRRFFYVYSYAYGQLISKALYERWKVDPTYAKKIKQFLLAGRSMSPEDIFKMIGIDTSKPSFFEAGLKSIEKDIERLDKLTRK